MDQMLVKQDYLYIMMLLLGVLMATMIFVVQRAWNEKMQGFHDAIMELLNKDVMTYVEIRDCVEMISNARLGRLLRNMVDSGEIKRGKGGIYYRVDREREAA